MKLLLLPALAWLAMAMICLAALVGSTEYNPFPDCTNDSTVCQNYSYYPYCVQCSPDLALCSAFPDGCGCAIPENQLRHDNTGSFLDHQETYMTKPHCVLSSRRARGEPDKRARYIYQCNNTRLIVLRQATAACPEPNTTCVDVEMGPGWRGGPTCVAGNTSGSVGMHLGRAFVWLSGIVTGMVLLS